MKKTASLIISAVLAATAAAPAVSASAASITVPEVTAVTGDINSDGSIAVSDAVLIMEYLLGKEEFTETQYKAADLNTDGNVDTFDFVVMREKIIAEIKSDIKENGISYRYDGTAMVKYLGCKKLLNGIDAVITSTDELKATFDGVFRPFVVTALCDIYDENYFKDNVLFIDAELWDDRYAVPDGTDISEENGVITITKHRKSLDDSDDTDCTKKQAILHQVSYPKENYTGQNVVWREEDAINLSYTRKTADQCDISDGFVTSFDELKNYIKEYNWSTDFTDEELTQEALDTLNQFYGSRVYDPDLDKMVVPAYFTEESATVFFESHAVLFRSAGYLTHDQFVNASKAVLRGNTLCLDYLIDPDIFGDVVVQGGEMYIFDKMELKGADLNNIEFEMTQCNPEKEEMILKDGPGKGGYNDNTVYVFKSDFAGRSFISIDADYVQFMSPCYNYKYIDDIEIDHDIADSFTNADIKVKKYVVSFDDFEISFPINKNGDIYTHIYPLPTFSSGSDNDASTKTETTPAPEDTEDTNKKSIHNGDYYISPDSAIDTPSDSFSLSELCGYECDYDPDRFNPLKLSLYDRAFIGSVDDVFYTVLDDGTHLLVQNVTVIDPLYGDVEKDDVCSVGMYGGYIKPDQLENNQIRSMLVISPEAEICQYFSENSEHKYIYDGPSDIYIYDDTDIKREPKPGDICLFLTHDVTDTPCLTTWGSWYIFHLDSDYFRNDEFNDYKLTMEEITEFFQKKRN